MIHRTNRHPCVKVLALLFGLPLLFGCGGTLRMTPQETALAQESYVLPTRTCGDFFLVDALINGRGPFTLMVDTGAQMTVLSTAVGDELDAKPMMFWARGEARGADGRAVPVVKRLAIETMRVGDLELRGIDAIIIDLDHLPPALGTHVDGLLGFGCFADLLLTLDYPGREIRLARGQLGDPADDPLIYQSTEDDRPVLQISIGERREEVLIDSGANTALNIEDVRGLRFQEELRPISSAAAVAGNYVQRAGRLAEDAHFGSIVLRKPIVAHTSGTSKVGTDVTRHFALTFDQKRDRIRLDPAGHGVVEFSPVYGVGAGFDRRTDRWIVIDVFENTPAKASGLEVGDVIIAINGRPVTSIGCERWETFEGAPQPLELQVQRHGELLELQVELTALVP